MASDKLAAEFIKLATRAGFTTDQASFLFNHLASKPHTHFSTEIIVDPEDGQTLDDFVEATQDAVSELETALFEDEEEPDAMAVVAEAGDEGEGDGD